MNFNASIIDQRISGILENYQHCLPKGDVIRQRSSAFILLCMSTCLDISMEESAELLTDGGEDAGVDGLHIGDVDDGEFLVTIFQGKYKIKDLSGTANFPENGVQKSKDTVQVLFDPQRKLSLNQRLAPKIEEIRSVIRDAYLPTVRVILCNNGAKWNAQAESWITQARQDYGDNVDFIHFNHDSIVQIMQKPQRVDAMLTLNGSAIVEDMNFMRVMVGRVSVQEIHRLFQDHGDKLLERNIRRYLGMNHNRVNSAIHATLRDKDRSDKFYFYNKGITVVCDKFDYNAFQKSDYKVQVKNMQIVNGGQTCKTIHETLSSSGSGAFDPQAFVLIRIYQLDEAQQDIVHDITFATNSQNPVDLRDLRSNDPIQKQLALGLNDLGYSYKRQREDGSGGPQVVTTSIVAESVLAIWRKRPHQAKFRRKEHFGKLYQDIFSQLNAAQALIAVLIFRAVENERKRPSLGSNDFIPYASHYLAMLIGQKLLKDQGLVQDTLSHRNVKEMRTLLEDQFPQLYQTALGGLAQAVRICYGERTVSLQQLSATFRRGDLLEILSELGFT